jgi:hypothetical protein
LEALLAALHLEGLLGINQAKPVKELRLAPSEEPY